MFTKEVTITLPIMIVLYEFYFLRREKYIDWKPVIPFLLFLFIIPLSMRMTKSVNFMEMRRISELASDISPIHYLLTEFRVIVTYLRLFFIPINQNLDYDYPISKALFALPTSASLLFLVLIILAAVRLFRGHKLISFSICWILLTLLPESSIIPIRDVIFEHRLYLPMFGYGLFLVSIIYYTFAKKSIPVTTLILIMIINWYALLTYTRNFDWRDELTLWNDTVSKSPRKARGYTSRGIAYKNVGNFDKAMCDYNKAIEIDPYYFEAYINRGNVYTERGDFDHAVFDYTKAIEMDPLNPETYYNRGRAYQLKGNLDEAISDYRKAIEISPEYAVAYNNRAMAYFGKREFNKSWEDVYKSESLGYKVTAVFIEKLRKESGRER
jgi:tetratricopeptide (TPR) repeat protein